MTLTPLSPSSGTLQNYSPPPIPDHIAAGDEATFIAAALEWRNRTLQGKDTHNDRQLVTAWLEQCSSTGSIETVKTYSRHIERFRTYLRGRHELGSKEQPDERLLAPGDPEAIIAFTSGLRAQVSATPSTMSVSTFNVVVAAISSFYKWCSQPTHRGFSGIPLSPVPSGLQMKKVQRRAKALSHESLHSVLHGARQCRNSASASRDALIIRLIYLLGTRATETVNLRWSDVVELESGPAIHIRRETAKGKKERFIPIHGPVFDVMDGLRDSQPESEWMLPNLKHPQNHISRQGLWKLCDRAGKNAGTKCWAHQLRHTHATHAYAATHDPKLIQSTLGHADISTTMELYVDQTAGDSSTKHLGGN